VNCCHSHTYKERSDEKRSIEGLEMNLAKTIKTGEIFYDGYVNGHRYYQRPE